jgi:hypothetical protein
VIDVGLSEEIGKTARYAIRSGRRTALLCILLLFGAAAGATFLYIYLDVLSQLFEPRLQL